MIGDVRLSIVFVIPHCLVRIGQFLPVNNSWGCNIHSPGVNLSV